MNRTSHEVHQPRERSVPCNTCQRRTLNIHGRCDSCLPGAPVSCPQRCREAVPA
ncbi:hypothetical protein [Kineococcus terrestris]|uniref:hypothetical protein n=1 Tax=Kineococcus terrestris TaxID=2044856 RepID=UPI0034DB03F9